MAEHRHLRACFGCSTTNASSLRIHVSELPDGAEGTVRFGREHVGAPGLVHGGLLATLADEVMGSVQHGGDAVRVTAEMTLQYRRPAPIDIDLLCRASLAEVQGRRYRVHAEIADAAEPDVVLAEADATYVLLDKATNR